MSLFNNRYRIESARSKLWDYGSNAMYFVTVNTHYKMHFFGEIVNDNMELSQLGIIANEYIDAMPTHYPFAEVDIHTVMPNHIHAIIRINKPKPTVTVDEINKFGPQSGKLGAIIRGYKSAITAYANENKLPFKWQGRFHDHIIKEEETYIKIYNYIANNPGIGRRINFIDVCKLHLHNPVRLSSRFGDAIIRLYQKQCCCLIVSFFNSGRDA